MHVVANNPLHCPVAVENLIEFFLDYLYFSVKHKENPLLQNANEVQIRILIEILMKRIMLVYLI